MRRPTSRPESRPAGRVELPGAEPGPLRTILVRLAIAIGLICAVALLSYLGRDGYTDPEDGSLSLLDAFYYSTVSITTTGYGDIRPVTDEARLVTTLVVTPLRVLFLILLVGTTLEILAERSRAAIRLARWRRTLNDHIIVCGYGTKGRTALRTLLGTGVDASQIVVIDPNGAAREDAGADGFATVAGDASSQDALEQAGIREARAVIVAVDRDDAAVLITLTARELAPRITISASVREEENAHLLHQSGASSVIVSSGAAGRLLGLSTDNPALVELLEDLLSVGEGLDVVEHEVGPSDAGPLRELDVGGPAIAILRDGELMRFDDERAEVLQPGDRVVGLRSYAR
jgi:voltage-gated potassium channel